MKQIGYRRRLPGSSETWPWPRRRCRRSSQRTCPGAISAHKHQHQQQSRDLWAKQSSPTGPREAEETEEVTDHGELAVGAAQVGVGAVAGHAQHRVQAAALAASSSSSASGHRNTTNQRSRSRTKLTCKFATPAHDLLTACLSVCLSVPDRVAASSNRAVVAAAPAGACALLIGARRRGSDRVALAWHGRRPTVRCICTRNRGEASSKRGNLRLALRPGIFSRRGRASVSIRARGACVWRRGRRVRRPRPAEGPLPVPGSVAAAPSSSLTGAGATGAVQCKPSACSGVAWGPAAAELLEAKTSGPDAPCVP
jgi:hypothetical protein